MEAEPSTIRTGRSLEHCSRHRLVWFRPRVRGQRHSRGLTFETTVTESSSPASRLEPAGRGSRCALAVIASLLPGDRLSVRCRTAMAGSWPMMFAWRQGPLLRRRHQSQCPEPSSHDAKGIQPRIGPPAQYVCRPARPPSADPRASAKAARDRLQRRERLARSLQCVDGRDESASNAMSVA